MPINQASQPLYFQGPTALTQILRNQVHYRSAYQTYIVQTLAITQAENHSKNRTHKLVLCPKQKKKKEKVGRGDGGAGQYSTIIV